MGTARQPSEQVVLVVDDEEALRHLMARALTDAGFRVLEAQDGEEAQALLDAFCGAVGVVVSDIAMPRGSGFELVNYIAERWPTVPVILTSGQAVPPEGYRGGFLPKPFAPGTLVEVVTGLVPFSESTTAS